MNKRAREGRAWIKARREARKVWRKTFIYPRLMESNEKFVKSFLDLDNTQYEAFKKAIVEPF